MTEIPKNHPRYKSLMMRERIAEGIRSGITSMQGMIAHGRGETFDYLMGEETIQPSAQAIKAGLAMLILAEHPVISVNGNVAALVPDGIVQLSELIPAQIEINIFHRTDERVRKIKEWLEEHGARNVLSETDARIPGITHERAKVSSRGIYKADTVLIPLEDGDRCEALMKMGGKTVSIDLNPLSRTSQTATISIVDSITRVVPRMIEVAQEMKDMPPEELKGIVSSFDNKKNLQHVLLHIKNRLDKPTF